MTEVIRPPAVNVSVVVATRNRPDRLRAALDGIARQTYPSFEVVLVDDGSTRPLSQLNESYARQLVRSVKYTYLASEPSQGGGPSFARNQGMQLAAGRLIAFCDDDDFWVDSEHLAECVRLFDEDAELDLVFANQQDHVDGHVLHVVRLPLLAARLKLTGQPSGRSFPLSKRDCLLEYFPHLNTCVFRRHLLDKVGGFWEGLRYAEDCDLYVRSIDVARGVRYRDKTVSVHNVPDGSKREGASTVLAKADAQLVCAYISQHLLQCCSHVEVIRYARRLGGDAYRHLSLLATRNGEHARAREFARLGLAAKFSLKWLLYTVFCSLRALVAARSDKAP